MANTPFNIMNFVLLFVACMMTIFTWTGDVYFFGADGNSIALNFQRSGSIMVLFGLIVEIRILRQVNTLKEIIENYNRIGIDKIGNGKTGIVNRGIVNGGIDKTFFTMLRNSVEITQIKVKALAVLNGFAVSTIIVGTTIWGYGDLIYGLFNTVP